MNKINFCKVTKISFVCFSALLVIFALVLFCQSIEVYNDGWGTDFSTNEDLLIGLIVSAIIFTYSLVKLISKKEESSLVSTKYLSMSIGATLVSLYSFGKFFKTLAKALSKGQEFVFADNQVYLYLGIVACALVVYAVFKYLDKKEA